MGLMTCRVIEGASDWMKKRNYWCGIDCESIDGLRGLVINDYTFLGGDDGHYEIDFGIPGLRSIGVNPQWLILDV